MKARPIIIFSLDSIVNMNIYSEYSEMIIRLDSYSKQI